MVIMFERANVPETSKEELRGGHTLLDIPIKSKLAFSFSLAEKCYEVHGTISIFTVLLVIVFIVIVASILKSKYLNKG